MLTSSELTLFPICELKKTLKKELYVKGTKETMFS